MNSVGDANIHAYDHDTGVMDGPYLLHAALQVDDHATPSVIVRNDGKLLTVYSAHNGSKIYARISSNVEDPSSWGAEIDVTQGEQIITYPSLIQLSGESNKVYCFYRNPAGASNHRTLCFETSTDGGSTWSAQTALCQLQTGSTPVFTYWRIHGSGGNRIDFLVSGHPVNNADSSVYHFYYTGGNYYKTDGTQITASLPITETDLTLIYDGSSIPGWGWDITISGGNPIATFATFPDPGVDTRYKYARWSGTEWVVTEICTAGAGVYPAEPYASVGMSLDRDNPNVVWAARYLGGTNCDMWKYVTADGGANWTGTQITSAIAYEFRPVVPRGADASLPVVWFTGRFTTYADYLTYIQLYLPA